MNSSFTKASDFPKEQSLVGHEISVDPKDNGEAAFAAIYSPRGFDPKNVFRVISDNQGKCAMGDCWRLIVFRDNQGHQATGNAARFLVHS